MGASHSNAGSDYTHDAPVVWVEGARSGSFTVCAREDRKHWNSYDTHSHRLNVEYYAFQGQRLNHQSKLVKDFNKPFPGAHFDTFSVPARSQAGTQCHTIGFGGPRPFDRVPIVVGSVDYQNFNEATNGHDAVAHWIDNVNTHQFRVCFIETEFTGNTAVDAFNFNWMAVEHRNPELFKDNQISYKAAGHVPTKGLWRAARADRESKGTVACKEIKYERPFGSTKPTVFVEGVHEKPGLDWAHADNSPATITYVNKVLPDRFEVCSTAMNQNQATDTSDEQLVWNWIAFAQ